MAGYDDWKSTEPDYLQDEWDRQFDAWEDPMNLEPVDWDTSDADEFPQDRSAIDGPDDFGALEFKEYVVNNLLNNIDEFLKFGTLRELMRLIINHV